MKIDPNWKLTDGEINNIVYLCHRFSCNWTMRAADLQVVTLMATPLPSGEAGIRHLVKTSAEYIWDHIMGEPEDCDPEALRIHLEALVLEWFGGNDPATRSNTN
jgi:hypothetical protein